MSNDSEVKFGADISDVGSKLDAMSSLLQTKFGDINGTLTQFSNQAKEATSGVTSSLDTLTGGFKSVQGALVSVATALAGGAIFKESVSKTIDLYTEANKLSRTLGITANEAGVLADALGDVGSSSEQYLGLSMRLGRQIKSNEEHLIAMGVATRDSSGNLRNQQEIMSQALAVLSQYKDGTDRNQAAMAIFGGRVGDINGILRVTDEKLKNTAETQKILGTEITPQNVAMMTKYKDTMADVGDVLDAFKKAIGDALLPTLIELGAWFASIGPAAIRITSATVSVFGEVLRTVSLIIEALWSTASTVFNLVGELILAIFGRGGSGTTALEVFVNTIKIVQIAIIGFRTVFEEVFTALSTGLNVAIIWLNGFANAAKAALSLDFSGVKTAISNTMNEVVETTRAGTAKMVAIAKDSVADVNDVLLNKTASGKKKDLPIPERGNKTFSASDTAPPTDQMDLFERNLLAMKRNYAAKNEFDELSLQSELRYWGNLLRVTTLSTSDKEAILKKQADLEFQILKNSHKEKIELEALSVEEASKYRLAGISMREQEAQQQLALGKITQAQLLGMETQFERERFEIAERAHARRIELILNDPTIDPVALQKALGAMDTIQQQYATKVIDLQGKVAQNSKTISDDAYRKKVELETKAYSEKVALESVAIDNTAKQRNSDISVREQEAQHQFEMGRISHSRLLAMEAQFERERFAIDEEAQAKRIELLLNDPTIDPVALQKSFGAMETLQESHSAKMVNLQNKAALEVKNSWEGIFAPITNAFEKSVTGMILGTTTLKAAWDNMGKSILAEFVSLGVKKAVAWAASEAAMLLATNTKNAAVAASNVSGATLAVGVKGVEATAVIGADAAEGAAGAAASQAAIPVIGPGLAIAAFAATLGLILGARNLISSSAGGEWNVPDDRLNFVHKNETILPANIATPLREMVEGGNGVGGININISAVDAAGVKRLFDNHGASLVGSLRKQVRAFNK